MVPKPLFPFRPSPFHQFLDTYLMATSIPLGRCLCPACNDEDCDVCKCPACNDEDCGVVLVIRRRNSDSSISSDGPTSPFSDDDPRSKQKSSPDHDHGFVESVSSPGAQQTTGTPLLAGTASDLPSGQNCPNAETEPAAKRLRFSDKPVWQVGVDWTGSSFYFWSQFIYQDKTECVC